MPGDPVGNKELVQIMKKMAVESGLSERELDEFLEDCAFEFGSVKLLRNLVGVGYDLEVVRNSYEYMRNRKPLSDFLPDVFAKVEKVLSIGCGSGAAEVNLAREGCQVWGIDTDKDGVNIANRLAEEIGFSEDCVFTEVDGYVYPFDDGFFDIVLYLHSLHEIDDKERSLGESNRVLKAGGRVIVVEDGNALKEVTESLEAANLAIAEEHTIPLGEIFGHGSVTSIVAMVLEKKES